MNKFILSICISLACVTNINSQVKRKCSTHDKYLELVKNDPELLQRRALYEKQKNEWILNKSAQKTNQENAIVTVPVVVHVLYQNATQNISTAQIQSQIVALNADFGRTNADAINTPAAFQSLASAVDIQFCLATIDPSGNPTTGIERKSVSIAHIGNGSSYYLTASGGLDAWDASSYLNIWVCDIDGGNTLGFAYLPGTTGPADDGVVIDYNFFGTIGTVSSPFDLGRTATHEVGHWFDMEHIWGDEPACAADDFVNDTPLQKEENYGCPSFPQTTQLGGRCNVADPSSMFMNYMDYSDDSCMNMFTIGQKNRMQAALNTQRTGLATSAGCAGAAGIVTSTQQLIIGISPNPSVGIFEINVGGAEGKLELNLIDVLGKLVYQNNFATNEKHSFDISSLPSGVYFAHITLNGKEAIKKIIKH